MEQRKELRATLRVPATMISRHGGRQEVILSDFSDQGALVTLENSQLVGPQDQEIVILYVVPDRQQPDQVQDVRARVMYRRGDQVGLSFIEAPRTLLEALRREVLQPPQKIVSPAIQTLMQAMQQVALSFFEENIKSFTATVLERLQAAQSTSRSDAESLQFKEAVSAFKQRQSTIQHRYMEYMHPVLTQFAAPGYSPEVQKQAQMRQLSLIDKDEFESWLVVKVMITKVEGAFREQLFALQLRLDDMLHTAAGKQFNPFAPLIACDALKYALSAYAPGMTLERLLYRAFDETVLAHLGKLYQELNQLMIRHGVLPELDLAKFMAKSSSARTADRVSETAPDNNEPEEAKDGPGQVVEPGPGERHMAAPAASSGSLSRAPQANLRALSEDLSQQQQIARAAYEAAKKLTELTQWVQETPVRGPVPLNTVEKQPLLDVLTRMQRDMDDSPELLINLQKDLAREGWGLSRQDLATCQMVDGLLSSMTGNDALTDAVHPWFHTLKIPLLKLVLMDEAVFQTDDHPARLVLNRLARLGMRGQVLTEAQRAEIQTVLDAIRLSEQTDDAVFATCLPTLDRMVHRQEELVERNLRRVAQLAESEQKRDLARKCVNEELDQRLAGKQVPRALLALLEAGWRDLLVMTYVRDGEEGDTWARYWAVIDDLLARGDHAATQLDLRELLARIKQGLQASGASMSPEAEQHIGMELKLLLSPAEGQEEAPRVMMPAASQEEDESLALKAQDPSLMRWLQRGRQLQVGDWIEMQRAEVATERLRLAWIGRDHGRFVFVNHQGMKVCDFSLNDLGTLLQGGELQILDAAPQSPVDDALERMVQSMYDQLTWASTHDELTGLVNRREFEKLLEQAVAQSGRTRVKHVLIHLDLDQFGLVNSDAGYEAGDALLREIVKILENIGHGQRQLARLGGDVFGALLENCDSNRAQQLIVKLMDDIANFRFTVGAKTFQLSCCMGVVDVNYQSESGDWLLRSAESACTLAKETPGGNRMQWWAPDDQEQARRQDVMAWVSRLNQALDEERLELRCQMIAPLSAEAVIDGPHYEILLSMQNDDGSLISPGEFMQAAERYNRMQAVDRWVIENVMRWMATNPDKLAKLGGFSINLSGHSLNDESLMEFIFQQFSKYEVQRSKLCFEVTETTAIANLADAADFIREMKKIGCKFALDDFGAGMSSYAYLKNLPVDFIKIDGSFIKHLDKDKDDYAMVKSIHEMARLLGKATIAEYVENQAILECLKEIGVDFVQGYEIEKPRLLSGL